MEIKGIDVSYYQGAIDWKKVKAAGIDFAIIRAGLGTGTVDKCFAANITGAAAAGVAVGIFWFSYAGTVEQAQAEADFCIKTIAPYKNRITYPVFFDWEYQSCSYIVARGYKPTKQLVSDMAIAFMERVKAAGYKVGNYSNPDYNSKYFNDAVKKYDLWLAHYVSKTNYSGKYTMWQHGTGTVNGISGKVDLDISYVDYAAGAVTTAPETSKYLVDYTSEQPSKVVQYSYSKQGNSFLSPHFQVKEFKSPDSDTVLIDNRLIWILERLFTELSCSKMVINSGYRTPAYSVKVGGTASDRHTTGMAADIKPYGKDGKIISGKEVCKAAEKHGDVFGIGYISETAVHVDARPRSAQWFGDETNGTSIIKAGFMSFAEYFAPRYKITAIQSGLTKAKADETAVYLRKLDMDVTITEVVK